MLAFTSFWLLSETELWIESWLVVHPTHSNDPRECGPHAVTPSELSLHLRSFVVAFKLAWKHKNTFFKSPWKLIYSALSCLSLVITSVQLFIVTTSCICSTHCQGLYLETDGNMYCCQKTVLGGSTVKQQHVPWWTSHYTHTSSANIIQLDLRKKALFQNLRGFVEYTGSCLLRQHHKL